MLEQSRSNINFSGKDGFHWFIGQVTADKAWRDKHNQNTNNGFRAKVRILGHHPSDNKKQGGIDDKDLPWAHFLVPPSMGAGHNYSGTSFAVQGGETVFGFFLDGEEGQQPVVIGSFYANSNITPYRTWEQVMEAGSSGFTPFTADTSIETGKHITPTYGKKQNDVGGLPDSNTQIIEQPETAVGEAGLRKPGETFSQYRKRVRGGSSSSVEILDKPTHELKVGEANAETVALAKAESTKGGNSEKSGNDITPEEEEDPIPSEENDVFIDNINKHYDNKPTEVRKAQKCADPKGALGDVAKILQAFTDEVSGYEKYKDGHIDPIINRIVNMDLLIERTSNKIAGGFSATIRQARKEMFKEVNKQVNESVNFLDPSHLIKNLEVKKQQDTVYCLMENVINGLKNFVSDFLKGMVGNLLQMPLCAAEQFISGLISDITDQVQGLIGPAINAINGLGGISLPPFGDFMDKALKIAQTGLKFLECEGNECEDEPIDWKTNVGADPKKKLDMGRALGLAKNLSGMTGLDALGDALGGGIIGGTLEGMFPGISKVRSAIDNPAGALSDVIGLDIETGLQKVTGLGRNITSIPNAQQFAEESAAFNQMSQLVGGCNPFQKECGPPKLELFGGGGIGAAGKAVINSIGEVVGVSMDDLGIGYTKKPFVSFVDNCGNGKGATGTADVDLNPESPTYGQITNVIVTNPGGGYLGPFPDIPVVGTTGDGTTVAADGTVVTPGTITGTGGTGTGGTGGGQTGGVDPVTGVVDDPELQGDGINDSTNVQNDDTGITSSDEGEDVLGEVTGIQVVTTGMKYADGDKVVTENGGELDLEVDERGRIIGSTGTCDLGLTSIPKLSVKTKTGYGAIIRPITKFVKRKDYKDPITTDVSLIRVIDCPRGF